MEHSDEPVNFRYDVVSIIKLSSAEELSRKEVRAILKKIKGQIVSDCTGDCLVASSHEDMIKVHFHTDNPEELFTVLEQYGSFESQAVEDMKEQYEIFKAKKEKEQNE